MKKHFIVATLVLISASLFAQKDTQVIIETKSTGLVLTVGNNQRLVQSYLGKKLPATDYAQLKGGREVYLTAGMENQSEPAIRIVHADYNPSLELVYVSHT